MCFLLAQVKHIQTNKSAKHAPFLSGSDFASHFFRWLVQKKSTPSLLTKAFFQTGWGSMESCLPRIFPFPYYSCFLSFDSLIWLHNTRC